MFPFDGSRESDRRRRRRRRAHKISWRRRGEDASGNRARRRGFHEESGKHAQSLGKCPIQMGGSHRDKGESHGAKGKSHRVTGRFHRATGKPRKAMGNPHRTKGRSHRARENVHGASGKFPTPKPLGDEMRRAAEVDRGFPSLAELYGLRWQVKTHFAQLRTTRACGRSRAGPRRACGRNCGKH